MIFLFGMFVVGEAMADSGYLACIANRFFSRAKNPDQIVLFILFGMGILSAILMNDTIAIIGTPLVLGLATQWKYLKKTPAPHTRFRYHNRERNEPDR